MRAAFRNLAVLFVAISLVVVIAEECDACGDGNSSDSHDMEGALLQRAPVRAASFFMFQLADPQFGLQHYGTLNWTDEQAMLNRSVLEINRLGPAFVVLAGDMQNWYETNVGGQNGPLANTTDAGALQVAAVKQSLSLLDPSIPLKATLPGNHDIGDAPTASSLAAYERNWGAPFGAFEMGGVRFLHINSQLYFNASNPGMQDAAELQTRWLESELRAAEAEPTVGVVILSHIPPFVGRADEPHGWANWPTATRRAILEATQSMPVPPRLIVCGHFHGNVEQVQSTAFEAVVEVVTTSSVGCPMLWNGSTTGAYTPEQAAVIAAQPTGSAAYENYIERTNAMGVPNFAVAAERVQARPDRSGVRVFEFHPSRGYRHRWFTLEELSAIQLLDAETLGSFPFTPFLSRSTPVKQAEKASVG